MLGNNPKYGGITYNTMELEEIKALPINEISNDNAVLFLWCTLPQLEKGLEVIKAWGFHYVTTAFVWIKINKNSANKKFFTKQDIRTGIGHWTNSNAEICLLGKRGKISRAKTNIKQVIFAPVTKHSAKPSEIRNRIVELMGDNLSKIELFARPSKDLLFEDKSYKNWDIWGDEI